MICFPKYVGYALIIYSVFCVVDVVLYGNAKFTDRVRHRVWPGSGFYSYFKYGPNR